MISPSTGSTGTHLYSVGPARDPPPPSIWGDTMSSPLQTSPDVLIVGGGIHGCSLGWELALRGLQVEVLEKSVPGAEASSAAGGILGPHLEAESPGPFLDMARYSMSLYPAWIEALEQSSGVEVGFERCGGLLAAFDPAEAELLRARASELAGLGLPAAWIDRKALLELEPGIGAALGAIHFPEEAQVEPRQLMAALTRAATAAGVRFVTDTVSTVEQGGSGVQVQCAGGQRTAGHVVVAAGAWSTVLRGTGLPSAAVQPARGQMALLELPARPSQSIVFSERGYVIPRASGQVLCGSTLEFEGFHKAVTVQGMRSMLDLAVEILPALAEARLVDSWSGFRPWTSDHLPILGRVEPGSPWLSTGHYRNGILLAPGSARVLADLICDRPPALDPLPFAPGRFG